MAGFDIGGYSLKIDMSYMGLNKVFAKDGLPKAETLIKIQEVTGCDLNWLLTGKGLPFADKSRPEKRWSIPGIQYQLRRGGHLGQSG